MSELERRKGVDTAAPSSLELSRIVGLHERFAFGKPGGRRGRFSHMQLGNVDLGGRVLDGADFTGASLQASRMVRTSLTEAVFFGADVTRGILDQAKLDRTDLRGARFRGASLVKATLRGADMREAILAVASKDGLRTASDGNSADLTSAIVRDADLSGAKFGTSMAMRADFSGANMSGVDLKGADIRNAVFRNANLEGATLAGSKIDNADFRGAVLTNANLDDCSFKNADFRGAIVDDRLLNEISSLGGMILTQPEDEGFDITIALAEHAQWVDSGGLEGGRLSVSAFDMRGLFLEKAVLVAAGLFGCIFYQSRMQGVDLEMADLTEADLRRVDMTDADLRGTSLMSAQLGSAVLDGAACTPFLVQGDVERRIPFRASGADFSGASLRNCDLREAVLFEADFSGADLRGADFRGADLSRARFDGASTEGMKVDG